LFISRIVAGGRVRVRLRSAFVWAALASLTPVAPALAQDELDAIYQQILNDPGNVELNLRYARLAIARGELRKAIGAFERVLAQDPQNAEAQAGLERVQRLLVQDVTSIVITAGIQGETNPRRQPISDPDTMDGSIFGRIQLYDNRLVGQTFRLRTEGDLFANYHFTFHDIDFGVVNLRSGPQFTINPQWVLHLFAQGGHAWLNARAFYWEAGGGATLETRTAQDPGMSLTARAGYNFITEGFTPLDAYFFELTPRLSWRALLYPSGTFVLSPYYRYNGTEGSGAPGVGPTGERFPLRFHQFGARADYLVELYDGVTLNLNITGEYRHYFEDKISEPGRRRDYLVIPGAQLIFNSIWETPLDLVVSYSYERLFPNDDAFRYHNHVIGVRVLWRIL
jgi:hypothetical protein